MLAFPPDFSFFVQILSFVVLWVGLKRLLFDPMLQVLEERDARTAGARKMAAEMRAAADSSAADHERRLQELRAAVAADGQSARAAVEAEERKLINAARDQAAAELSQLRDNLTRQAESARVGIAAEARTLATQMVERVVGRQLA
jgi:F-type H+-transporting ATPase subunit b